MSVLFQRVGEGATVLQVLILSVLAFLAVCILVQQCISVFVDMRTNDGRWIWEVEEGDDC